MSKSHKRAFIITDTHIEAIDKRAYNLAKEVASYVSPDIWIHMGDYMDLHNLSVHHKDHRLIHMTAQYALDLMRDDIIEWQKKILPRKCEMSIGEGNHDIRVKTAVERRVPHVASLLDVPTILQLKERGIKWHPYDADQIIKIGSSKLHWTHAPPYGGVNSGRRSALEGQINLIHGHLHTWSGFQHVDSLGQHKGVWSVPCLCDKNDPAMAYMRNRFRFQQGFAVVDMFEGGSFFVQNVQIIDYKCFVDGRRFKG